MVDSIFIFVGNSLGRCNAFTEENAAMHTTGCIYGGMRVAWIFVWNTVRSGAGVAVWAEFSGDGNMDSCRPAVGFYPWSEQFFLRNPDYADCLGASVCGAEYRECVRMRILRKSFGNETLFLIKKQFVLTIIQVIK